MPGINITGRAGAPAGGQTSGDSPFGVRDQFANARGENARVDQAARAAAKVYADAYNDAMDANSRRNQASASSARASREKAKGEAAEYIKAYQEAMDANSRRDQASAADKRSIREKAREEAKIYADAYSEAMQLNARRGQAAQARARSEAAAFRNSPMAGVVTNVRSLGMRSMREIDTGSWVAAARTKRELRKTEKRFGSDPRVAEELRIARSRTAAARAGRSRVSLGIGDMVEMGTGLLAIPGVGEVAAGAMAAASAPMALSGIMNKAWGASQGYISPRLKSATLGRAGGFDSLGLLNSVAPGGHAPQWMKDLGIGPEDAVNTLGRYGILSSNNDTNLSSIKQIYGAHFRPGLSMSVDQATSSANFASQLGIAGAGNLNTYFDKLQKVTTSAVSMGMDRSQTISNVEGLLRQSAASGGLGLGDGSGVMRSYMRVARSGLAGARTGDIQAQGIAGMNAAFAGAGYGGNSLQTAAIAAWVAKKGGLPKTMDQLKAMIGPAANSPGAGAFLGDLLDASKAGDMMGFSTILGKTFVQGNADLGKEIGSSLPNGSMAPYMRKFQVGGASALGYNYVTADDAGGKVPSLGAGPRAVDYSKLSPGLLASARQAAADAGIDPALLVGRMMIESSGDPAQGAKGNGGGVMQMNPDALKQIGMQGADMSNPATSLQAGAKYLAWLRNTSFAGDKNANYEALVGYNWGPGHTADIRAGNIPDVYKQRAVNAQAFGSQYTTFTNNMPSDINAVKANTEQAGFNAGNRMFTLDKFFGGNAGDAAIDATQGNMGALYHEGAVALQGFTKSVAGATKALDKLRGNDQAGPLGGNFITPMWTP